MSEVSPDRFMDAVLAYQQTAAIKAAIELDLFSHLGIGPRTAAALAEACGAAERGMRILCDTLTVHGHLEKQGDSYRLTPSSAAFLDRAAPTWMGNVIEYLAAPEMLDLFLRDPAGMVRNGGSAGLANNAPDHPIWVTFARAMGPSRVGLAGQVAAALAPRAPRRVLDVAAGHGMVGIALARALPTAEVTALDWQAVLAVAEENAAAAGVAARFRSLAGSAFVCDWGGGYDLVLLCNFLHQLDRDGCVTLLRKAQASLGAGGGVAVVDWVLNEDRVSPRLPALFSFQMLGTTPTGEAYTAREFEAMGQAAGFATTTVAPLPPTPQSLILFERG